jgi:rubredoxin
MRDDELEVVAELATPIEAEIAAGRLEAEGINAQLEIRGGFGAPFPVSGSLGTVAILVRSEDADIARTLLETLDDDFEPEVPPEYADDAQSELCPECGSTSKRFRRESPVFWMLPRSLIDRDDTGHRWICRDCGHVWIVERPG